MALNSVSFVVFTLAIRFTVRLNSYSFHGIASRTREMLSLLADKLPIAVFGLTDNHAKITRQCSN